MRTIKRYLTTLLLIPVLNTPLHAGDSDATTEHLVKVKSAYGVAQTITRLENVL